MRHGKARMGGKHSAEEDVIFTLFCALCGAPPPLVQVSPVERASVDDLISSPAVQRFLHASKERESDPPAAKPRSAEATSSRRPPASNGVPPGAAGAPRPRSNEGPLSHAAAAAAHAAAALRAPPQVRLLAWPKILIFPPFCFPAALGNPPCPSPPRDRVL